MELSSRVDITVVGRAAAVDTSKMFGVAVLVGPAAEAVVVTS